MKKSILLFLAFLPLPLVTQAADSQSPPLADTTWELLQFQSMDDAIGTLEPADSSQYVMTLNADGTAAFRLDCNRGTATWSARASADGDSGSLEFGPLASTRALCPPPNLDERLARDMGYVTSYIIRDGQLHLSLMADAGIYSWRPVDGGGTGNVPLSPEDGGPRYWQVAAEGGLNLRMQANTSSGRVKAYTNGTLLNNLGCVAGQERAWCDVQEIGGGPRGYVAADFLVPAVAPHGAVLMGEDDSALRAGMGDFDANGSLPCRVGDGQLLQNCAFRVARAGGGDATLVVNRPDGMERVIFFQMGVPVGFSSSEAQGYPEFSTSRTGDNYRVRIGQELYEIPDAAVFGG